MMLILTLIIIFSFLPTMFIMTNLILSKKDRLNQEKSTPFECGFDPLSTNRLPFSIQFFMVCMVFLVFDIEIVLLIPLISMIKTPSSPMIIMSYIFLIILIMGLYFEYMENSLEWKL